MENNDSVCYISRISEIKRIRDADKIEIAEVNGWRSIVQKDIHKSRDYVLCIVTDAVIPKELAEKWGVDRYLRKGFRVRTVKLKGEYSDCILIPLNDIGIDFVPDGQSEGKDMMTALGIFKYEQPENTHVGTGSGQPRSSKNRVNQNFNKYHKFPNIKNVPNMFNNGDNVVITRKIHGSNARYGILKKSRITLWDRLRRLFGNKYVEYEYVYGSHNVQKVGKEPGYYKTDVWAAVAEKYNIEERLWSYFKSNIVNPGVGYVIHGEIYGPGIQGEKYDYNLKEVDFVGFDVESDNSYCAQQLKENIFKLLDIPMVPKLYEGPWSKEVQDKHLLNQYIEGGKIPHEGVVVSCQTGDRQKIAKVINPEYHTFSEKHHVPDGH